MFFAKLNESPILERNNPRVEKRLPDVPLGLPQTSTLFDSSVNFEAKRINMSGEAARQITDFTQANDTKTKTKDIIGRSSRGLDQESEPANNRKSMGVKSKRDFNNRFSRVFEELDIIEKQNNLFSQEFATKKILTLNNQYSQLKQELLEMRQTSASLIETSFDNSKIDSKLLEQQKIINSLEETNKFLSNECGQNSLALRVI